jgi:hypothetical protein
MAGAVQLTGAAKLHRPLPSRAYKRAAPSSSFPAPAAAIPLLPRPSSIRGRAAAFVFLPGEPSLSSPCPSIGPSSDCLSLLASPHRHGRSTPLPHPDFSPKAHRRQPRREAPPPPREQPPPRPPLTKLSPPLGSPAHPHAKAPAHCPRTGPPAANRRRAHRRPGPPPRTAGSSHRQPLTPFSPPSALSGVWAPRRRRRPRAPAPPLPWAATGPAHSRPRTFCARLGQFPPPTAHQRLNSFFFSFFQPFSP